MALEIAEEVSNSVEGLGVRAGKRVGLLVEFNKFFEDKVAMGLGEGIGGKIMEQGMEWPIQLLGFGDAPPQAETEACGLLAVAEVGGYESGKGTGTGFGALEGVVDAFPIGAEHLSEHELVVAAVVFIGGGDAIHGAGDAEHLLVGIGVEDGVIYAIEIERGRGRGGIHGTGGGCSSLRQIHKQLARNFDFV